MKPGDRIICINDQDWDDDCPALFNKLPVEGKIYQIRRLVPNLDEANGPDGIALEGIFGEWDQFKTYDGRIVFEEYSFKKDRFRLLDEIDLLKEMLENHTKVPLKEVECSPVDDYKFNTS